MRSTLLTLLLVVAGGYLAICAVLYFFQRSLLYMPTLAGSDSVERFDYDGAKLALTVRPREGDKALLYFGGNAEDVAYSLPELASAFPDHSLYLQHYRGYGGSEGAPSEAALHADALALYEKVRRDHPSVTLVGRSLGSGVAVRLAAEREVERLVLVTPFYSIAELAAEQFPWIPVRWLMLDRFESWRHAPKVKAPVTVIVAEHDEVIPLESSLKLRELFDKSLVRYELLRGVGHNDISANPDYIRVLAGYL